MRTTASRLGTAAWIFILAAIGAVQVFRGAYVDAAIFFATVAGLLIDVTGRLPEGRSRHLPHAAILVVALVVVAGSLILTPRHGILATIVVVVLGVVVLLLAWPDPAGERKPWTRAATRSAIAWSALGVAACLWELTIYILGTVAHGGRTAYPALSDLLNPFMDAPVFRGVFVLGWLAVGVFLLRRVVRR